ncbi:unnamed protein product [Spirodela intermedia]|uniref:FAF domain-containing protein n=1 Tax=Spirodela intermedia TaxID=51605 RepID=A0A7I8L6D9_SPIIN|nr:unnamed protein product [Spirodela intermedia]
MTALGSLGGLFEKPTLVAPLPWGEIKAEGAGFSEIFGELHFEERGPAEDQETPPSTAAQGAAGGGFPSPPGMPAGASGGGSYSSRGHTESLQFCTEGLGFESSDDVEDLSGWEWGAGRGKEAAAHRRSASEGCSRYCSRRRGRTKPDFPPPISCFGSGGGKPCVRFRSFRQDGRFVLTEVPLPCQEFLRAFRKDGRLMLHFVQPAAADLNEVAEDPGDGDVYGDGEEGGKEPEEDDGAPDKTE